MSQNYNTRVSPEDVILGNDAIMKCSIPSFVSDFVQVQDWKDSEGLLLFPDANYGTNYGTNYPDTIFSRDLEGATKCGTVGLNFGAPFCKTLFSTFLNEFNIYFSSLFM